MRLPMTAAERRVFNDGLQVRVEATFLVPPAREPNRRINLAILKVADALGRGDAR